MLRKLSPIRDKVILRVKREVYRGLIYIPNGPLSRVDRGEVEVVGPEVKELYYGMIVRFQPQKALHLNIVDDSEDRFIYIVLREKWIYFEQVCDYVGLVCKDRLVLRRLTQKSSGKLFMPENQDRSMWDFAQVIKSGADDIKLGDFIMTESLMGSHPYDVGNNSYFVLDRSQVVGIVPEFQINDLNLD